MFWPLALVSLSFSLPAFTQQLSISSRTLVDALSADPDYESLLRLLQRARLIPTLNRLNGSTFFAPTNDAIHRHDLWNAVASDDTFIVSDNIQEQLRQQLFYHLINYTLPEMPDAPHPQVLQTLHYPRTSLDPPSQDPPPSPPWMPIPGGSLGSEPQRLRVAARDQGAWVAVDAFGKGGVEIVKGKIDAGNGLLLGIDDVLTPPSNLAHLVSQHSSVSYFHKILTPEIRHFLNSTTELTLFLPVDKAFESLHELERLYLESEFATADLVRILNGHAVVQDKVKWSDTFDPSGKLKTIDGTVLDIVVTPEKTSVSTAELLHPDIYASNGVLHLVSSLMVDLEITPEKYLLALNCTSFVSLIHSVNLTGLVNDTEAKYTILAPRDDVLSLFGDGDLPEKGSEELKKLLEYHFIPGTWSPKKLNDGMLLETALIEDGLDGGRQVLNTAVSGGEKKKDDKSIKFGGVGVIGDPIVVNNTLIYFISRPLVPPSDALETLLPLTDLSLFLASVFSASMADRLKTPRTSLLVPHNSAFKELGELVSAHLLAPSSKKDLANVLLHHTLDTVEYAQTIQNGSRTFATLEGTDVQLEHLKNGSVLISGSGGWDGMKAELFPRDILTQTGVLHEVSDVLIPRSVQLTIGKLVKAADATTMVTLVTKAGMDWVLNGSAPPPDSIWAEQGLNGVGWTLLCPQDDAFKLYNLTELYADLEGVRALVSQHLIPTPIRSSDSETALNNNRPLLLEDSATYSTLRSPSSAYGDVIFRRTDTDDFIVGIKGARGTDGDADWARVLSWGRSTTGGGTGGVIEIHRLLVPYNPSWLVEYGGPTFVGVGGIILICLFFFGVRAFWRRDFTHATYEPVETRILKPTLKAATSAIKSDTPVEEVKASATDSIKSFIAGGFGGVAAVLVGHPFDLTKTRLQTAPAGLYTGAIDVVKKTVAQDGLTGLYRGMLPPLLGVTPIFAISFWAYDASKKLILSSTPNRKSDALSIPELAAAGFMSAIPTTLVTAPVERAKVLLQVQGQGGSEQKYKGVLDVMKHLYREGGIRSIFRGAGATVLRDGPGSAAYFAAYEVTKKALTPAGSSPSELNLGAIIMAGGTAGVAMWAVAIPPDVLKSRLQSAPNGTYSGFMDCARKTIAQDGVRALWKGFGPAMSRAFPANAATFLGVEASRNLMDKFF
ncbi:carnitine/acyl carnitine carrier [Mycena metata]|uniref:Carnitine/acyl carnitine carrier n=1 Tax=Mycena metata TaxID=1033252 RepID=A0AAD7KJC4_9AGAR|nr:carnitine/acyl carnitine carrier [Mycena metata]